MKKLSFLFLIFLIFSCTVTDDDSDSSKLKLTLPSIDDVNRAIEDIYNTPGPYYARVYTLAYGIVYPIGESEDYKEFLLTENQSSMELNEIPACSEYVLWLAIGTKMPNGAFNVKVYGESDPFELMPGNVVDINIELKDSPFIKAENSLGYEVKSILRFNSNIIAPTSNSVYFGDYVTTPEPDLVLSEYPFPVPGFTINSISRGFIKIGTSTVQDFLLINTNDGLVAWGGSGFNISDFSSAFSDNLDGTVPILKSCAFVDVDGPDTNVALYYMRDGGFGGVYIDSINPLDWDWLDVDLSEIVVGQPALDLITAPGYAYFITKFGAFRLDEQLIQGYDEGEDANYTGLAEFFEIRDNNGDYINILCAAYYLAGDRIFLGTEDGLWYVDVNTSGENVFQNTPSQFERTAGHRIERIMVNNNYVVASTPAYIYIVRKSDTSVKRLPFISGIPGEITTIAIWNLNVVLFSGTEGITALDLSNFDSF